MATLASASIADSAHWQQPRYIENSFITIAMEREHGPDSGVLNKWQNPVAYQIDDRTADAELHKRMVMQQLGHLASITGLSIRPTASPAEANLQIIFSSEQQLEDELETDLGVNSSTFRNQITRDSVCVGRIQVAASSEIKQAMVLIPVDRARAHGKLMACVVEELTQILGLVNDSSDVYPSIFNDRSFNDFLSGLDFVLLKLLYHPDMQSGMSRAEVRHEARRIMASSEFKLQIDEAERLVKQGSLESWLD